MSANLVTRNTLFLVSVLLVIALLGGAALLNHSPPSAQAQFFDDGFDPSPAFERPLTVAPVADFSADPTSGPAPLQVQFADGSAGNPTGWAWYFGDEAYDAPWMQMTSGTLWTARSNHTSVSLPDGSIVLMGGRDASGRRNDVWRSTDQGATWTEMIGAAGWVGRELHTSVALPDGSIVLMGGWDGSNYLNDVWRSTDQGATWTQMTAAAEWEGRERHTSVALPDGSIVLMGGTGKSGAVTVIFSSVWRSTDQGATWTQLIVLAPWGPKYDHASVALPDGSIVLMGGRLRRDRWRSTDQGATWTQMTGDAGWTGRSEHTSVALPDGSIVLMGGRHNVNNVLVPVNDVWRSTDQGANWTQMTAAAEWTARYGHTSVGLPDGSIVLMGGWSNGRRNDVWRSTDQGATWTPPREPEAPAITSASSVNFTIDEDNAFIITATGVPIPALECTGTLPSGVSFTDNGNGTATLAGTPPAGSAGVYNLTITASNGVLPNATQSFTLTVLDEAIDAHIYLPLVIRQ